MFSLVTPLPLSGHSKPHCTDIMEIYNAVENMEYSDDEVRLVIQPVFSLRFPGEHEI